MTTRIAPLLLVAALGLVACGSDSDSPAANDSLPPVVDDSAPPGTDDASAPSEGAYDHPTGADEVVVSYAELGGFLPREFAFQQTPNVLISGDGRSFSPGAQIAIYPGPLLPAVQVWNIGEDGIQQVLAAAEAAGLFADIDYDQPTNIADASTATVTINVNGTTYVHEAYALGIGGGPEGGQTESTPERQALLDFIGQLTELTTPGPTGDPGIFEPAEYGIEALVVDDLSAYGADGIEPTVVEWPADASVRLVDATSCTVVPASEVGEILGEATQLTFFTDADVTYQVLAKPLLPGADC
jgi:hypothetical protein